jgi:hypothetical protein
MLARTALSAVNATANTARAVSVRAGESAVNAYLFEPLAVFVSQIRA